MIDKRQQPRVPLVLRVEFPDRAGALHEWTENISAGGLFVRTAQCFPMGTRVTISVSFPGLLPPTAVEGRVAWIRSGDASTPAGFGLEVTTDAARRQLAEIVLTVLHPRLSNTDRPFKVLVAEDNVMLRCSYERVLRALSAIARTKLDVTFVSDGHAALHHLESHGADLLVLDIYMPVMDGFAVLERLRQSPTWSDLPIIVVTSGSTDEAARVKALGVEAFLHKPFQLGEILETIACLVASRTP
jgi:uncharacterized protein (TIGR02266 family)